MYAREQSSFRLDIPLQKLVQVAAVETLENFEEIRFLDAVHVPVIVGFDHVRRFQKFPSKFGKLFDEKIVLWVMAVLLCQQLRAPENVILNLG